MALQQKVGTFTLNSDGTSTTVTGLGFTPTVVFLLQAVPGTTSLDALTAGAAMSFGASDGTNNACFSYRDDNGGDTSESARLLSTSYAAAALSAASGTTGDALNWGVSLGSFASGEFVATPSGTFGSDQSIFYVALGGVTAEVGTDTTKTTTTGTKTTTLTNSSLEADALFFGAVASGNTSTSILTHALAMLGFAAGTGSTDQGSVALVTYDNLDFPRSARRMESGKAIVFASHDFTDPQDESPDAAVSAIAAGEFTLNYSAVEPTATTFFYVALDGVDAEFFTHTQATTNTTNSASLSTLTPELVFLSSFSAPISLSPNSHARMAIGVSDGTNDRGIGVASQDNADTQAAQRVATDDYALWLLSYTSTDQGRAAIGFDAVNDEVDFTWDQTDGVARTIFGLAFGDSTAQAVPTLSAATATSIGQTTATVGCTVTF